MRSNLTFERASAKTEHVKANLIGCDLEICGNACSRAPYTETVHTRSIFARGIRSPAAIQATSSGSALPHNLVYPYTILVQMRSGSLQLLSD
jgi:hypothetical protein